MEFDLASHQNRLIQSKTKFTALVGGIGSGKTWTLAHYVIHKVKTDPHTMGFLGANTYRQLNRVVMKTLMQQLTLCRIRHKYHKSDGIITVNGTEIICASLDEPEIQRGIEIGWFGLDEGATMKEHVFDIMIGRLRCPLANTLEGRVFTSPFGFNWVYDYFAGDKKTDEFELIQASSMDNPFLNESYIKTLKSTYDPKLLQQEVFAQFINLTTGKVYYSFDRGHNVGIVKRDVKKDPDGNIIAPVYIGLDFNNTPFCGIIANVTRDSIRQFDELRVEGANTHEIRDQIKEKYGTKNIIIIPDSTGKALKTSSAGLSDHEILRQAGFKVIDTRNPFRQDRYNTMNNLLHSDSKFVKGEKRYMVDESCKETIKDFEQCGFKPGSNIIARSKEFGHLTDGAGYAGYHFFPSNIPEQRSGSSRYV